MSEQFIAKDKLTLLFYMNSFNIPLTNSQITCFFTENNLYNYFDFQQLLNDTLAVNLICSMEIKERSLYSLTEKGKSTLLLFSNRIPKKTKKQINQYTLENKNSFKTENQLTSSFNRIDATNYEAVCRVMEGNVTLVELKLSLGSASQAKQICSSWKEKAPLVYKRIMDTLITD